MKLSFETERPKENVLEKRLTEGDHESKKQTKLKFNSISITSMLCSVLGGCIFGYNTGVIAGALDPLSATFHGLSDITEEVITASIIIGAAVGSLGSGFLADYFGRKKIMIAFSFISVGGVAFLGAAPSVATVVVARGILGLSIGGFSYVCPLYASETSPPHNRGFITATIQTSIVFSAFIAYLINLVFQSTTDGWRYMFGLGAIPCVAILAVSVFRLQESPRWLVVNGRQEEAEETLALIVGPENVHDEIYNIQQTSKHGAAKWSELFTWKLRKPMLLGLILAVGNQLTGNNAVTYYAPKILESAGFPEGTVATGVTAGIGFWKFVATVFTITRIDRYGRRRFMLVGLTVMGTGAAVMGISFFVLGAKPLAAVGVISLLVFVGGYELGPGPLFYVVGSEIYPDKVRGRAMSLINAIQWFFNFLLTQFFVTVVAAIGGGPTFFIFVAVCLFCFLVLFFLLPETNNKTLDEVQEMMGD